jgi:hypothetical protein
MCDFKPGDEVVCISAEEGYPFRGVTYTVAAVLPPLSSHLFGIRLTTDTEDMFDLPAQGWAHTIFRKVQRRNDSLSIEAFLTIKPGFEEPRRTKTPARKGVDA